MQNFKRIKPKYYFILIFASLYSLTSCGDIDKQTIENESFSIKISDNLKKEDYVSINRAIIVKNTSAKIIYGQKYDFYIIVFEDKKSKLDKEYTIQNFKNPLIDTLWKQNKYLKSYEEEINGNNVCITEISTRDSTKEHGYEGYNCFWRIAVTESDKSFFTIFTYEKALRHGYFRNEETREAIRSFKIK